MPKDKFPAGNELVDVEVRPSERDVDRPELTKETRKMPKSAAEAWRDA